jgi:hypothetical protein
MCARVRNVFSIVPRSITTAVLPVIMAGTTEAASREAVPHISIMAVVPDHSRKISSSRCRDRKI